MINLKQYKGNRLEFLNYFTKITFKINNVYEN
jgi:hypothetical protein